MELKWPPKFIEVTEAGVPLICAEAGAGSRTSAVTNNVSAATVAEFSLSTYE